MISAELHLTHDFVLVSAVSSHFVRLISLYDCHATNEPAQPRAELQELFDVCMASFSGQHLLDRDCRLVARDPFAAFECHIQP